MTHLEARLKKAEGQATEKEELARKGLAESQRLVRGGWFASSCRGSAGWCVDYRPRAAAQSSWWCWRRQGRLLDARDERVKALQAALRQMQKNETKRAEKEEARAAGAGDSSGGGSGSGRADSGQVAPERRFIQVSTPIRAVRSV
eukprot:COSAG01_NODE_382_length_17840_cov_68.658663_10_plen_145_part_00